MGKNLIGMLATVAYAANPDGYQLPQVLILHLSHRDIELISDSGSDRFQYLTLAFKGLIFRQTQPYFADTYVHLHSSAAGGWRHPLPQSNFVLS